MKKIILLLVVGLALPSVLSAQEKSIAQKIWSGELWEELGESKAVRNAKKDIDLAIIMSSEAHIHSGDLFDRRDRIYNIEVPQSGFFKFLYDQTEAALLTVSKRGYHRETGFFLPAKKVRVPDMAKSQVEEYAYKHAAQARQRVLDSLKKDPFGDSAKVDDETTRRAYEYRQAILECGGLDACEVEVEQAYGEKKVAEYKTILQTREEWLIYKDKNPIFNLYTLTGKFEDLKFLNQADYANLVEFFSGQEPAEGWQYTQLPEKDYYVNPSQLNHQKSVIRGKEILVKISDNLEASILPENLNIRIYKVK